MMQVLRMADKLRVHTIGAGSAKSRSGSTRSGSTLGLSKSTHSQRAYSADSPFDDAAHGFEDREERSKSFSSYSHTMSMQHKQLISHPSAASAASTTNYSMCVQQPGSLKQAHVLYEEEGMDTMEMELHMDEMQRQLEMEQLHLAEEGTMSDSVTDASVSVSVSTASDDEDGLEAHNHAANRSPRTPSKQYLIQIDSVDSHARTAMEVMYRKATGDSIGVAVARDGIEVVAERVAEQQLRHYDSASASSDNCEEDEDMKREEVTNSFSPRQSVDEAEEDEHTEVLSGNVTTKQGASEPYATFLSLPRSADSMASTEYTVSASSTNCTASSSTTMSSVSGACSSSTSASIITMSGTCSGQSASNSGYPNYLIKSSTGDSHCESEYYANATKCPYQL